MTAKMGDEIITAISQQFWKDYRLELDRVIQGLDATPEFKDSLRKGYEQIGSSALSLLRIGFNNVDELIDGELDRSRRASLLVKSAINALRAMRADGMADDLQDTLDFIWKKPVGSAQAIERIVRAGTPPEGFVGTGGAPPIASVQWSGGSHGSGTIYPTPRRGKDDGK